MTKKKDIPIEESILTIDVGTQSVRAVIIDLNGEIQHIVKTPLEPYFSNQPGWAEQEAEYFWKKLCYTTKKLIRSMSISKEAIKGVTITTQRNTVINIDKNGNPIRPAIVWMDDRRAKIEKWPSFFTKSILKIINLQDAIEYTISECESNWIRQNQPDIWSNTYKYLFLSGYLTYKLTGEYVDSTGNIVGYVPFDYKTQEWAKSSDMKWKMFPMDRSILPSLVKPTELLGYISKKVSKETGIPSGLPIIASAADKACEILGSGCLSPETACLSYGTSSIIGTASKKYVEVIPFFPPYPSAVPDEYHTEIIIRRGFWMVSWFKREFGHKEEMIARRRGVQPEELFDELVSEIDPGSIGLILQPYWSPGVKIPGQEAKGAIIGFGEIHTRAHLYRAILEGLVYALKDGAIRTEKKNKVKIEKLRVAGGGSQSDIVMQLTSDIFDLPAERPHTFETSALGSAIDAAVGLKYYPDFESAVKGMVRINDVFEPIPVNRDIYKELFEQVYLKMYGKLKSLYIKIGKITEYPAFWQEKRSRK